MQNMSPSVRSNILFFLPLLIHSKTAERTGKTEADTGTITIGEDYVHFKVNARAVDGNLNLPVCAVMLDYGLILTSSHKPSVKDGVCTSKLYPSSS